MVVDQAPIIKRIPVPPVEHQKHHYVGSIPSQQVLKAGTVLNAGHRALASDLLLEQDVAIRMRDGVTLYADVYRPPGAKAGTVPAIIAGGPFGKTGGPNKANFNRWPWRHGCPRSATTGLEKFEGPDPGYWCYHGYAVVHTDCRGTWKSEGDVVLPSVHEGNDNYDIVEFLAAQEWCNGKVSMCGNSYLTMTQWFTGAAQPPHLTCLAPWEGVSDLYNDLVCRGGIPLPGFTAGLLRGDIATLTGSHCDDIISAIDEYPTWNSYWKNHAARLDKILCPMYVVSSWTNLLHVSGTFRGWEKSASKEKWLRVHDSHEWPDLYEPSNVEDLRRFYDYYMKGINNGWEFTPKVRLCVLNPSGRNVVNRPETSFPLARQQPLKLYLHAVHMSLTRHPPAVEGTFSYDAGSGSAVFKMVVEDRFEFTGYIKARLWAEAIGSDDMDVFVFLQKFDRTTGQVLESVVVDVARLADDPEVERQGLLDLRAKHKDLTQAYFDDGPFGCLRASHRALDDKESTEFHPVYKHEKEDLLRPGEVVALDIAFWPYGMIFEQGEEMRITVTGTHYKLHLRPEDVRPVSRNHGTHKFYTGPERQSYILLPLIPSVSHRPEAS